MTNHLRPCASCERHVRAFETVCPFCAAELPVAGPPPGMPDPGARLSRAAIFAFSATLLAGACESQQPPSVSAEPTVAPTPVAPTPVAPTPAPVAQPTPPAEGTPIARPPEVPTPPVQPSEPPRPVVSIAMRYGLAPRPDPVRPVPETPRPPGSVAARYGAPPRR